MILALLLSASAAAAPAPAATAAPVDNAMIREAAHALDAGRMDQARLMIARAVDAGMSGLPLQKLMADYAFASARYEDALAQYKALARAGDHQEQVCERAAISALNLGRASEAEPYADCATASRAATWRAWNARGVIADLARNWSLAARSYARALELAPGRAEIINNQGWSLVLRGDWADALPYFEKAASLDPKAQRIADNLELARAALAADLPDRRPGETDRDWAARLNDAGVVARLQGDSKRAVSAFTQALYASGEWYERAANNLKSASNP